MMKKIMFDRLTDYLGKTDVRKCKGVNIFLQKDIVYIQAINDRGGDGQSYIGIPKEQAGTLCEILQQYTNDK